VTLRARLLLALLAMAVLPLAAFTLFTLDQLDRATARWFRPGVEHALGSALEVSRSSLTRVEAFAVGSAEQWAPRVRGGLDAARRDALRHALESSRLDFIQVYRERGGLWTLDEQITPPAVLSTREPDFGERVSAALEGARVVRSEQGALAGVALAEPGVAVAAGVWVPPDFFNQVQSVGEGVSRYRQLGVIVPIQRRYVWLLVTALVVLLALLAIVFATFFARGFARPLRHLSEAIGRVATGDLRTRVRPIGALEMRTLAGSFNQMAASLESARASLRQAEREAAWRDVARHLAHDLKNPLTAMRYALHRIQSRVERVPPEDRAAVAESVDTILSEVQHLAAMTDRFARHARQEAPLFEPTDLKGIARNVAALHGPEMLDLKLDAGDAMVSGDPVMLTRAVQNVVVNALEAVPNGQPVELHVHAANGRGWIEVLDRGCGLPEGPVERLFEPDVSTKERGSGLGLTLVRDVMRDHGGGVVLENREGGGVCARIWLPLASVSGKETLQG
jgi:nitrogen fixation/metabolism regulation signal transduction histidine kinase